MNANQTAIWERNKALYERFQELSANADATARDWEILAGHYIEAGYYSNASTCFTRADAIKDKNVSGIHSRRSIASILEVVAAPWDEVNAP